MNFWSPVSKTLLQRQEETTILLFDPLVTASLSFCMQCCHNKCRLCTHVYILFSWTIQYWIGYTEVWKAGKCLQRAFINGQQNLGVFCQQIPTSHNVSVEMRHRVSLFPHWIVLAYISRGSVKTTWETLAEVEILLLTPNNHCLLLLWLLELPSQTLSHPHWLPWPIHDGIIVLQQSTGFCDKRRKSVPESIDS